MDVDERAARVAGVDDGIGLKNVAGLGAVAARADDALGEGSAETERVADSEDSLTDSYLIGIGEFQNGKVMVGIDDFDDGDVGLWIGADELGFVAFLVVGGDADFEGVGDNVVIGENVAFLGDDDAGAETGDDFEAAEEAVESFLLEVLGVDADDTRKGPLGERGNFFIKAAEGGSGGAVGWGR